METEWHRIAREALDKAGDIKCTQEEYLEGLKVIVEQLQEATACVQE